MSEMFIARMALAGYLPPYPVRRILRPRFMCASILFQIVTDGCLHASDRCTRRARVSLRPTAAIHERQEIADDAIELVGRLEVDGMAAVRHDGESGGGDILFHQHTRQQTGPILVSSQDERGNGQASHLVDEII